MPPGQATTEYTALLALIAAALAAAGAVTGPAAIGRAVTATVRTGICIAGGDVCRASDAEAAGLAPCTTSEQTRGGGATITLVSVRLGRRGEWTVARRSDGSVVVTHAEDRAAGVAGGIGVEASPLGIELGAEGAYELTLASGRAWEFPDAAAAARFLADPDRERRPATWRFADIGGDLAGEVGAGAGGAMLTGLEASAAAAAGARTGRGQTTLYVRARLDGPGASALLPGGRARVHGPGTGDLLVELTRDSGGLREIAFRRAERGARPGQVVETVGRLDLRVPANRAAAAPLLARRLPWPPGVAAELRAVVRRTAQAGVVERAVYEVRDDSREIEASARLGIELGVDLARARVDRRLVAASAWTAGSGERERVDCRQRSLQSAAAGNRGA